MLVVNSDDEIALPNGPFVPDDHASLEDGFRQLIETQAGLDLYYVEQLYTFGNRFRTALEIEGGPRTLSVAYVALTREDEAPLEGTRWANWYEFLPWEDWRNGRPDELDSLIAPQLAEWCTKSRAQQTRRNREERVNVTFGSSGATEMDGVLTLERLELLYDAGIMAEAERDHRAINAASPAHPAKNIGTSMASDHRRVLATALGRIRGKLAYRPVVFELLPGEFTLLQLQRVAEALSGTHLHKQNFRRLVESAGLVEPTGEVRVKTGGRPARLYRFRREVVLERPAPGVRVNLGRS